MSEEITIRLDLIASKARVLAADAKSGKLWAADLVVGLSEIRKLSNEAERAVCGLSGGDR